MSSLNRTIKKKPIFWFLWFFYCILLYVKLDFLYKKCRCYSGELQNVLGTIRVYWNPGALKISFGLTIHFFPQRSLPIKIRPLHPLKDGKCSSPLLWPTYALELPTDGQLLPKFWPRTMVSLCLQPLTGHLVKLPFLSECHLLFLESAQPWQVKDKFINRFILDQNRNSSLYDIRGTIFRRRCHIGCSRCPLSFPCPSIFWLRMYGRYWYRTNVHTTNISHYKMVSR